MSFEMQALEEAVASFDVEADHEFVDARRLSGVIDRLQGKLCRVVAAASKRKEHLLTGDSPTGWVAKQCQISKSAAADRLCVGEQLGRLPLVAEALSTGAIGFQSASVICHLQERLAEAGASIEEEEGGGRGRGGARKGVAGGGGRTGGAGGRAGL